MVHPSLTLPYQLFRLGQDILAQAALKIVTRFEDGAERLRTRRQLAGLDDRMLSDIGRTRAEALQEAEKPFWKE